MGEENLRKSMQELERPVMAVMVPELIPQLAMGSRRSRRFTFQLWIGVPEVAFSIVDQLRHSIDQMPERKIPEIRFLTDEDWLRAAQAPRAGFDRGNTVEAAEFLRFGSECSTGEPGRASSFLKLFAFRDVYCYRPKARELNLIDYASSVFSLFAIQSLTGGKTMPLSYDEQIRRKFRR